MDLAPYDGRVTPFLKAHSTEQAGTHDNPCGDDRYYNNLFVKAGNLGPYDEAMMPVWMNGNVYLQGARPSKHETAPLVRTNFDPALKLVERADGWYLELTLDKDWLSAQSHKLVTYRTAWQGDNSKPALRTTGRLAAPSRYGLLRQSPVGSQPFPRSI